MDASMPSFSFGAGTTEPARGKTPGKGKARSAKPINHAVNAPAGSGISFGSQNQHAAQGCNGTWQANGAFAELDANQQPAFNRSRFAAEAKPAKAAEGHPFGAAENSSRAAAGAAPTAPAGAADTMRTWAAMLNSIQNQKYDSPGAAAFGRNNHQRNATAGAQQQPKAAPAAGGFAGFGSPMAQPAQAPPRAQGLWFAPPPVPTGASPAAGMPPGSAMSTDTAMPTAKGTTAPFSNQPYYSVMSVDMATTPVFSFGSGGSAEGQQPGPRAAQVSLHVPLGTHTLDQQQYSGAV